MHSLIGSIDMKAPVQRVYDFINQPKNLPSIWSAMHQVSNVTAGIGGGFDFDWIYKMAGAHLKGHTKVVETKPGKLLVTKSEGAVESTFRWIFEGLDGGGTRVTCEVEYALPGALFGRIAEAILVKLNKREQETTLANLKDVMEHEAIAASAAARMH